jgi:hypothetical protein
MTAPIHINTGTYPNDGTGDDLKTAFDIVNTNFQNLAISAPIDSAIDAIDSGVSLYAGKSGSSLEFKTLTSNNSTITIVDNTTSIDLASVTHLATDPAPLLNHNLNQNGHSIYGGDVQSTIFGYDIAMFGGLIQTMIASNALPVDMGSIMHPTGVSIRDQEGFVIDMGSIAGSQPTNQIDFGRIV